MKFWCLVCWFWKFVGLKWSVALGRIKLLFLKHNSLFPLWYYKSNQAYQRIVLYVTLDVLETWLPFSFMILHVKLNIPNNCAICYFRSATGENWHNIMLACARGAKCDESLPAARGRTDCGDNFSYVYFISFIFFCSFLVSLKFLIYFHYIFKMYYVTLTALL